MHPINYRDEPNSELVRPDLWLPGNPPSAIVRAVPKFIWALSANMPRRATMDPAGARLFVHEHMGHRFRQPLQLVSSVI